MVLENTAKTLRSLVYIDIPALRPGTLGAYALAIVSVVVATALRLALDPYLTGVQFITFVPAILITTLISGFGAGFLAAVLSTASADFFVLSPRFSFFPETSADLVDLLLFGPLVSYLAIVVAQMRSAIEREQVEASKDLLQFALDAARLGWWQYDPVHHAVLWDRRLKEMFDVAEDNTDVEEFRRRVTFEFNGRQYVAIASGRSPLAKRRADNIPELKEQRNATVLYVFGL